MKKRKGISLIVLVITIIIMLIVAGAIILTLSNNNIILVASEGVFKNDLSAFRDEANIYLNNYYLNNDVSLDTFFADSDKFVVEEQLQTDNIFNIITSLKDSKYKDDIKIIKGEVKYIGSNDKYREYANELGMLEDLGIGTRNKEEASYLKPYVPNDFYYKEGNLEEGYVITDAYLNEFVWVPVDGNDVKYEQWLDDYNNIILRSLPNLLISTENQTTQDIIVQKDREQVDKYQGFYIGRYEACFDYNGGDYRVSSKRSGNVTYQDWRNIRDDKHDRCLWNYIHPDNAKKYSEEMGIKYNYNKDEVVTGLANKIQYDTILKWIQLSGKNVNTDSRNWGNYPNSLSPANKEGSGSLQISGKYDEWSARNIYDIAGNMWEMTNSLKVSGANVSVGGSCSSVLKNASAVSTVVRNDAINSNFGFRVVLYIK